MRGLAGQAIPDSRGPRICDAYGVQLDAATLRGHPHTECHDAIGGHVFREALQSGIRGSVCPFSVFTAVLPPGRRRAWASYLTP